jgi:hypothetical protein
MGERRLILRGQPHLIVDLAMVHPRSGGAKHRSLDSLIGVGIGIGIGQLE